MAILTFQEAFKKSRLKHLQRHYSTMRYPSFTFTLPDWLMNFSPRETSFPEIQSRMELAIELSRLNVVHETGGPFAAAIFDINSHQLLAPGVNIVVPARCSILHAEIVAIMTAQRIVDHFTLGSDPAVDYEMVVSTEPCAMCFGAIPWSGIRRLVCGARREDAERIGFDEGPKPVNWVESLENRGIVVTRDVCREQAASVLQDYHESGGIIYTGHKSTI